MEDLIAVGVLGTFGSFVILERWSPARRFPRVAWWWLKGPVFFALLLVLSTFAAQLWDGWLAQHRLFDGSRLGTWPGAIVAFFVIQAGVYAWHRTMHRVPFLWRWFHQTHHSAERIDTLGAFYFHPLDMLGFTFVASFGALFLAGVSPESAVIAGSAGTFLSMFQHSNLRTPRWLGYFIQRPEAHCLHHARGIHRYNYGDIVLFDMLLGTYANPESFEGEVGLGPGRSRQLGRLPLGRDLLAEEAAAPSEARPAPV